jgi:uncharacterized protein (DUF2062 family)
MNIERQGFSKSKSAFVVSIYNPKPTAQLPISMLKTGAVKTDQCNMSLKTVFRHDKHRRFLVLTPQWLIGCMAIFHKFRDCVGKWIARLKNYEGNPRKIALGVAIGVFIGVTPLFPFHTVIALLLAMLLKGSKIGAAAGVWVSNPVTLPFFYIITYKTGALFLEGTPDVNISQQSFSDFVHAGLDITHAMIMGSIVIGIVLSIAAYLATLQLISALRKRRAAG